MQVAANHQFMQVNQTPSGTHLIQTLDGICGHLPRWASVERFLHSVFDRSEMRNSPVDQWAINKARSDVLDALEIAFKGETQWPMIRKRALNFFGRSGMERYL